MSEKVVVLVDGKNIAYRMHYSHIALQTKDGIPTGMLHGFLYNILRLHKAEPEARFVFCWDGSSPTWRHTLQKNYKANRKVSPEFSRMQTQLSVLEPMLDTLGFHTPKIAGVECDDLMGILAKSLVGEGFRVRLHSADSDLYQLLQLKGVEVWKNWDQKTITAPDVEKTEGIAPKDWVHLEAMAGGHNNLKGLWKVGPIKAQVLWSAGARPDKSWAQQTIKIQTLLASHREEWPRIQQEFHMATIVTDIDSKVWNETQQTELSKVIALVGKHPERRRQHSEEMERVFYKFLGVFELEELFKQRSVFWKMK